MSRVMWILALLSPVAVVVFGLRWALSDFLLDRFGPRSRLDAYDETAEEGSS